MYVDRSREDNTEINWWFQTKCHIECSHPTDHEPDSNRLLSANNNDNNAMLHAIFFIQVLFDHSWQFWGGSTLDKYIFLSFLFLWFYFFTLSFVVDQKEKKIKICQQWIDTTYWWCNIREFIIQLKREKEWGGWIIQTESERRDEGCAVSVTHNIQFWWPHFVEKFERFSCYRSIEPWKPNTFSSFLMVGFLKRGNLMHEKRTWWCSRKNSR